jgi:hypothetical protein
VVVCCTPWECVLLARGPPPGPCPANASSRSPSWIGMGQIVFRARSTRMSCNPTAACVSACISARGHTRVCALLDVCMSCHCMNVCMYVCMMYVCAGRTNDHMRGACAGLTCMRFPFGEYDPPYIISTSSGRTSKKFPFASNADVSITNHCQLRASSKLT